MSWVLAFLLALLVFLATMFVLKAPRAAWEPIGAALLLGIAGYGIQASPGLSGAPKPAAQTITGDPAAIVEARGAMAERGIPPNNRWLVIADGLARRGRFADAASVLLGAVGDDQANGEAWLALANALTAHADGMLTPASLFAYRQAAQAEPDSPGPPFFLGLAMAQSGRLAEAHALWKSLLGRSPPDAPWREDLEARIAGLEEFMASQRTVR